MARVVKISAVEAQQAKGGIAARLLSLFRVFGAPAAWIIQLSLGAAIASYPCLTEGTIYTTAPLGPAGDRVILFVVNLVALAVGAVAALLAVAAWLKVAEVRADLPAAAIADRPGRARYLAMWGMLNALGFLGAIVFDTVMLAGSPAQC